MRRKKSSSSANIPILDKLRQLGLLWAAYARQSRALNNMEATFADLDEYDRLLLEYAGKRLRGARILEIGYGARPNRLLAMTSMGLDASGVDLDVPVLRGTLAEFGNMFRRNGFERTAKSLARWMFFDHLERKCLARELKNRGHDLRILPERFRVEDAADLSLPEHSLDLIVSEDVFEHIPALSLEVLVPAMAVWLKAGGLALIRPNIFTGISGGHLVEWFAYNLHGTRLRRRSEPWEHLRKQRYRANTFLNALSRADYRRLFSAHFEILAERVTAPDLGKAFLTPDVARDLAAYSPEELFSNQVLFVLRPR